MAKTALRRRRESGMARLERKWCGACEYRVAGGGLRGDGQPACGCRQCVGGRGRVGVGRTVVSARAAARERLTRPAAYYAALAPNSNARSHRMSRHPLRQQAPSARLRRILWADFTAGTTAGAFVLSLSTWLESIYAIPRLLLLFMGTAGLLYASLAIALASRSVPPPPLVALLGSANLVWAAVCVLIALTLFSSASWLGLAHLVVEAAFVSWLGVTELRLRCGSQGAGASQGAT